MSDADARASRFVTIPKIEVTVGAVLAAAIFLATAAFIWAPGPYREALVFFAAGCAAAGQLAVALYTVRTLQLTIRTQTDAAQHLAEQERRIDARYRQDAVSRFAERWNDSSMHEVRTQCRELYKEEINQKRCGN
jgi:hypothetical protein